MERMKEWQAVLKRVEGEKLREEQEGRAKDRLAAEHRCSALEKTLAKLQADLSHCSERLKAKTTEAEGLTKSLNLSGVQARDLQKDVAQLTAEVQATTRERDEARQSAARAQEALNRANMAAASANSTHNAQEIKMREAFAHEKAKLVAAADEARREAAVQKTLADGWARDLRHAQVCT
ncbi:hypothetical protein DUNSADRAFT_3785 [Dunaliella salina]|uniref:Uncharacterized protein n=1 Tax=Dunaliella salina TaxID=3046 RepID=A0ABQ7FV58_DUNSA|nr:hypothetical protein DUNSADRAFT_3785 [Dunaliella salina]|eukprot:KAF5826276.1 hypothetical protein DUNSADRAFT_3785 [Dunaliella salina]